MFEDDWLVAKTNFGVKANVENVKITPVWQGAEVERRFPKTIFGPLRSEGKDEFAGEDDSQRRVLDPPGRGAKRNSRFAPLVHAN